MRIVLLLAGGLSACQSALLSPLGRARPSFDLSICGGMKEDVVLCCGRVVLGIALAPVIADSIGVDAPILVEGTAGNGC